ncbi:MAG: hypothetical protein WDW36_007581 [Sanguina aurantia]
MQAKGHAGDSSDDNSLFADNDTDTDAGSDLDLDIDHDDSDVRSPLPATLNPTLTAPHVPRGQSQAPQAPQTLRPPASTGPAPAKATLRNSFNPDNTRVTAAPNPTRRSAADGEASGGLLCDSDGMLSLSGSGSASFSGITGSVAAGDGKSGSSTRPTTPAPSQQAQPVLSRPAANDSFPSAAILLSRATSSTSHTSVPSTSTHRSGSTMRSQPQPAQPPPAPVPFSNPSSGRSSSRGQNNPDPRVGAAAAFRSSPYSSNLPDSDDSDKDPGFDESQDDLQSPQEPGSLLSTSMQNIVEYTNQRPQQGRINQQLQQQQQQQQQQQEQEYDDSDQEQESQDQFRQQQQQQQQQGGLRLQQAQSPILSLRSQLQRQQQQPLDQRVPPPPDRDPRQTARVSYNLPDMGASQSGDDYSEDDDVADVSRMSQGFSSPLQLESSPEVRGRAVYGGNSRQVARQMSPLSTDYEDDDADDGFDDPRNTDPRARTSQGNFTRPGPAAARSPPPEQEAQEVCSRPPTTWDVRDVCVWVDSIGMGQYRQKFAHHCIDGRLLVTLTDAQLKLELGIGPMGHRAMILGTLADLADDDVTGGGDSGDGGEGGRSGGRGNSGSGGASRRSPSVGRRSMSRPASALPREQSPRRPASASRAVIPPDSFLGPASGKQTVYEQRAKLLFALDKAQARTTQQSILVRQLRSQSATSRGQVSSLRGRLTDLERKTGFTEGGAGMTVAALGLTSEARIPWLPIGWGTKMDNHNPERFARPGENPLIDETFKPTITKKKVEAVKTAAGGATSTGDRFLDGLAAREKAYRKTHPQRKKYEPKRPAAWGTTPCGVLNGGYAVQPVHAPRPTNDDNGNNTSAGGFGRQKGPGDQSGPMDEKARERCDAEYLAASVRARCGEAVASGLNDNQDQTIDTIFQDKQDEWDLKLKGISLKAILSKRGPAKVAQAANAFRTLAFLERAGGDVTKRQSTDKHRDHAAWKSGPGARIEAADKADIAEAETYFALLGWVRGSEPASGVATQVANTVAGASAFAARAQAGECVYSRPPGQDPWLYLPLDALLEGASEPRSSTHRNSPISPQWVVVPEACPGSEPHAAPEAAASAAGACVCTPVRQDVQCSPCGRTRAKAYRVQYVQWWDIVRDRAAERAHGFAVDVDWTRRPWCDDKLTGLMQSEAERVNADEAASDAAQRGRFERRSAAATTTTTSQASRRPYSAQLSGTPHTTQDSSGFEPQRSMRQGGFPAPQRPTSASSALRRSGSRIQDQDPDLDPAPVVTTLPDFVDYTVQLLGGSSVSDLQAMQVVHLFDTKTNDRFEHLDEKIQELQGKIQELVERDLDPSRPSAVQRKAQEEINALNASLAALKGTLAVKIQRRWSLKLLGVYRTIRMRKFLEMTEQAARDKATKTAATYSSMQAQALLLPASAMDAFFQRLMDDSQRRQAKPSHVSDRGDPAGPM